MNTTQSDLSPDLGPLDLNIIEEPKVGEIFRAEEGRFDFQQRIHEIWQDFEEASKQRNFNIMKWLGNNLPPTPSGEDYVEPEELRLRGLEAACYYYVLLNVDEDTEGNYRLHRPGEPLLLSEKDDYISSLRYGTSEMVLYLYNALYKGIYDDSEEKKLLEKVTEMRERMNMSTSSAN